MRKILLIVCFLLFSGSADANVTGDLLTSAAEKIAGEMNHIKQSMTGYMRFVSFLQRTNNTSIRRPALDMSSFRLSWLQEALPLADATAETASYPEAIGEIRNKAFILTRSSRYGDHMPQFRGEDVDLTQYLLLPGRQTYAESCVSRIVPAKLRPYFKPPFITSEESGETYVHLFVPMPSEGAALDGYLTTAGGTVQGNVSGSITVTAEGLRLGDVPDREDLLYIRNLRELLVSKFTSGEIPYFSIPAAMREKIQNAVWKYRGDFEGTNANVDNTAYMFMVLQNDSDVKEIFDYFTDRYTKPEEAYDAIAAWNDRFAVNGVGIEDLRKSVISPNLTSAKGLKLDNLVFTEEYNGPAIQVDIRNFYSSLSDVASRPNFLEFNTTFFDRFTTANENRISSSIFMPGWTHYRDAVNTAFFYLGRYDADGSKVRKGYNLDMTAESVILQSERGTDNLLTIKSDKNIHFDAPLTTISGNAVFNTDQAVFSSIPQFNGNVSYSAFSAEPNKTIMSVDMLNFHDSTEPKAVFERDGKDLDIEAETAFHTSHVYVNGKKVVNQIVNTHMINHNEDRKYFIPMYADGYERGTVTEEMILNVARSLWTHTASTSTNYKNLFNAVPALNFLATDPAWQNAKKRIISPYVNLRLLDASSVTKEERIDYVNYFYSHIEQVQHLETDIDLLRTAFVEIPALKEYVDERGINPADIVGGRFRLYVEMIDKDLSPVIEKFESYVITEKLNQSAEPLRENQYLHPNGLNSTLGQSTNPKYEELRLIGTFARYYFKPNMTEPLIYDEKTNVACAFDRINGQIFAGNFPYPTITGSAAVYPYYAKRKLDINLLGADGTNRLNKSYKVDYPTIRDYRMEPTVIVRSCYSNGTDSLAIHLSSYKVYYVPEVLYVLSYKN